MTSLYHKTMRHAGERSEDYVTRLHSMYPARVYQAVSPYSASHYNWLRWKNMQKVAETTAMVMNAAYSLVIRDSANNIIDRIPYV